jgi:hypothetical protein
LSDCALIRRKTLRKAAALRNVLRCEWPKKANEKRPIDMRKLSLKIKEVPVWLATCSCGLHSLWVEE